MTRRGEPSRSLRLERLDQTQQVIGQPFASQRGIEQSARAMRQAQQYTATGIQPAAPDERQAIADHGALPGPLRKDLDCLGIL